MHQLFFISRQLSKTKIATILHEIAAVMQCYIKQELDPYTGEETFKKMVLEANQSLMKNSEVTNTMKRMTMRS